MLASAQLRVRGLVALCAALAGHPRADTPWEAVTNLSREHLLESSLWASMKESELREAIPAHLARDLVWAYRRTVVTNVRLRAQLLDAVAALNGEGIAPVLLKGAAYLLDGTFGRPSHRAMWDLDLLVDRSDLAVATGALRSIGYEEQPARTMDSDHERSFRKEGEAVLLDIHFELGELPVTSVFPTEEALTTSTERHEQGIRFRTLAPAQVMLHGVLHSELQDLNHAVGGIAVRQLYTYSVLAREFGDRVDWELVRVRLAASGLEGVHAAHSHLLRRLFGVESDPDATVAARAHYARCLVGFGLVWPPDVERNLRFAFDPVYMRRRYGGRSVTVARARHVRALWAERRQSVLHDVLTMRSR